MSRILVAIVVASCTTLGAGCATGPAVRLTTAESLRFDAPVLRASTSIEKEAALDDSPRSEKATPALFWTGVAVGALGTVGLAGFGIAAGQKENEIQDSFGGSLSQGEFDALDQRGQLLNNLAYTSAAIALAGWALATIVYGVDYSRCGPMAPKKRNCDAAR